MASVFLVLDGDWTLPEGGHVVDLNGPVELPGALFHWNAESLQVGSLASWADLVSGSAWPCFGGVTVVEDQGGKAVSTDGTSGLLIKNHAMAQPHTIVMVARYREVPTNGAFLMNPSGGAVLNVGVASPGSGYISSAGNSVSAGPGQPLADTNYHVLVTVFDGVNSTVIVDHAKASPVDLGPNPRTGFRGGFGATYSKINYKEVVAYPKALDVNEINYVLARLRDEHPELP